MTILKLTLLVLSFYTSNLFAIRLTEERPSRIESIAEELVEARPNLLNNIPVQE